MTEWAAFTTQLAPPAPRESGCSEDSATFSRRLIKIVGANALPAGRRAFPEPVRLHGNGLAGSITNAGTRGELAGFVLNAPLSSVICH
jgi:hypothetical protein